MTTKRYLTISSDGIEILGWITHIFIYLRIYRSKKWFLFEDSIVDYSTIANEYFKV